MFVLQHILHMQANKCPVYGCRQKVGTADQLAFFLPGVVSQIGKVLHVSKTMISGAAGSMEAMDQALRGLAEFLMIVLQDEVNPSSLDDSGIDLNMNKSPLSFLEELCRLPGKKQDQGDIRSTGKEYYGLLLCGKDRI